jgi:hypothetical protein
MAKLPLVQGILERAEPALVVALSVDAAADPDLRLSAAEVAASAHAIGAKELAEAYRTATAQNGAAGRRAQLYQAVVRERSGARRTQAMKTLLDEARRNALYVPIATMLVDDVRSLRQDQETVAFAETAIEIALAAGDYPMAVGWAIFGSTGDRRGGGTALLHWFTLVDVAGGGTSIPPGSGHKFVEDLAAAGRVSPQFLHRLITVLDAIGAGIPAALWQAASRVPQPMDGYLPPTGVLPALGEAARSRHFGLTVLLAVRALGPDGAEGASPLALTDTIRALESAGLKTEARRVAFEALFSGWPRAAAR